MPISTVLHTVVDHFLLYLIYDKGFKFMCQQFFTLQMKGFSRVIDCEAPFFCWHL